MSNAGGEVTHHISKMQDVSEEKEIGSLRETMDHIMRHPVRRRDLEFKLHDTLCSAIDLH